MFDEIVAAERDGNPLIVSEIGAKYTTLGNIKKMVESSRDCGADYVKFQTYDARTIAAPDSFFTMEDGSRVSQFDFFRRHQFSREDHEEIIACCEELGIGWFSTPSHPNDVDLLETFNPPCYKTGSDDLTNLPFLRILAKTGRPLIVSTGMCTLDEVEKAVEAVVTSGNSRLILLHCVVSYPSRPEDANLKAIETLRRAFGFPVGLSDHTRDEFTSVLASQMGVGFIEKHFTLDHAMKLPDHEASLDPAEFKRLVEKVRLVRTAMGSGEKTILEAEKKWREAGRKSLFAARPLKAGETLREEDLVLRRPGTGIHPHEIEKVVGREVMREVGELEMIQWNMLGS